MDAAAADNTVVDGQVRPGGIERSESRAARGRGRSVPTCGYAFLLVAIALGIRSAAAADAPKELNGRSIVVAWSEDRLQRREGERDFRRVTIHSRYLMYVSIAGRIFSRYAIETPRGHTAKKESIGGSERRVTEFDGHRMVVVQAAAAGGARQIIVTFDDDFRTCQAQITRGVEAGRDKLVTDALTDPGRIEIKSAKASAAACRLLDRNVFGGE